MSWMSCPICETKNPPRTPRCTSCGADFSDPDVRAMAGIAPAAEADDGAEIGSLASSRLFGISIDSLADGVALRRLGVAGAVALAIGFVIPMSPNFARLHMPWELLSGGPALWLIYPLIAAAIGLFAVLARGLSPVWRAAMLTGAGIAGLMFCLPGLGEYAGTPQKLMPLVSAALAAAGAALIVRSVEPKNLRARRVLVGAAAACAVGLLIPLSEAYRFLPVELRFFADADSLAHATPVGTYLEVFNRDPIVLFSTIYLLLPLVLLPAAAVIAWPRPAGPWDKSGLVLRPLASVVVFYVPFGLLLYVFNMMGLNEQAMVYLEGKVTTFDAFAKTLMVGRAKLAVLAGVFALWAQLGAVILLLRARSDRSPPADRKRRSASESSPA